MVVVACVRWKVLAFFAAGGAAAIPALWFLMKDYQRQRVLTFLNPSSTHWARGYHVIQSKIAVGSGGIIGKGYLQGTQGSLRFLPEQHTDFAFAVFSEEWGFLGSLLLLVLFLLLVYRLFFLTVRSQDRFASFACGGFAVFFLTHIVINLAMVCGLFPVVGIPLPFVSYGGSSMLTNMMALGVAAKSVPLPVHVPGGRGESAGDLFLISEASSRDIPTEAPIHRLATFPPGSRRNSTGAWLTRNSLRNSFGSAVRVVTFSAPGSPGPSPSGRRAGRSGGTSCRPAGDNDVSRSNSTR